MIRFARSNWETSLLVCKKCSKRQEGGFGDKGRTPLAKALRKALGGKKGRKARAGVTEVKCLGLCPRHAVVMIDGRNPREWLLVKPGTDLEVLIAEIGLDSDGGEG